MKVVETINKNNITEFDFVRLEYWDDFDTIERIITEKFGFLILEKLDGIAIRKRVFMKNNFKFILMHDDHVGNYVFCDEEKDVHILRVLTKDIAEIFK